MNAMRWVCAAACVMLLSGIALLSAQDAKAEQKPYLITSFEAGDPTVANPKSGNSRVVKEHASLGEYSMRVDSSAGGYEGLDITNGGALGKFKDYALFKFDVFNPQDEPVMFGLRIDDVHSKSWGTRHNAELAAPPGWSTQEINLSALILSDSKGNTSKNKLDPAKLKLLGIFMSPMNQKVSLYIDNIRLEPTTFPQVKGLRAFDFGPPQAPVYPGFEACTQKNRWSDAAEFGWVNPWMFDNVYVPDALAGDYGSGDAFKVKLPNGSYEVTFAMNPYGVWGRYPTYSSRQVSINGKEVLNQTMGGREFLEKGIFLHERDEDLPGEDLWNRYVAQRNTSFHFTTEVTDGVLNVEFKSGDKHGRHVMYLVVYPTASKQAGDAWLASLEKQRHDAFNKKVFVSVPKATGDAVTPTAQETARGFVTFVRHTEEDVAVTAKPFKAELNKPLAIEAALGERTYGQIGVYPLKAVPGATVEVSDLAGPGGAKIASSAITVRMVRNFNKRPGRTFMANLLPYMLMDFKTLDFKPGVTRGLWVTLTVPEDAKAGAYTGTIRIKGAGGTAAVPVNVTVWPFKLDKVTDIMMSVTGAKSTELGVWYPELRGYDAKMDDLVMQDLAAHGMNAVNSGPNARLLGVKDGKAQIDYTAIDAWLEKAVKAGLTHMSDSYGGLKVDGMPEDTGAEGPQRDEAQSQAQFGMSYTELLKIVWGDYDRHMKEKGFPQRAHSFLDEPRPEWNNVQSCAELIKLKTAACPDVLFAGYYFTGQGRDVYFQTMPVSITQINRASLKLATDAGKQIWEYDGNRVRYNIGRWCFVASRLGLDGYLRNGYFYTCTDPYFDFSDDEASWGVNYPGRDGIVGTVGWERTGQGVSDYRYLSTCERLIKEARAQNKALAQADAAEAAMKETLKGVDLEKRESAALDPAGYDQFRREIAKHIAALSTALGR